MNRSNSVKIESFYVGTENYFIYFPPCPDTHSEAPVSRLSRRTLNFEKIDILLSIFMRVTLIKIDPFDDSRPLLVTSDSADRPGRIQSTHICLGSATIFYGINFAGETFQYDQ